MSNRFFLFAFLLQCYTVAGQLQPMFQTTLYFEDAVGNKDSISVGFDTLANSSFNPQFGEMDISTPFDSIFEVRATNWSSFGWGEGAYILSKKIISAAESNAGDPLCYTGGGAIFFIHARYQPIRVSWQQSDFDDYCVRGSFFTPDRVHQMIDLWDWLEMPAIRFGCAAGTNTYELALGDAFQAPLEIPYIAMQETEGSSGELDSIYGVALGLGIADGYFVPCNQIATHENQQHRLRYDFEILPNPAAEQISIINQHGVNIHALTVYNRLGERVAEYPAEQNRSQMDLNISPLAPGIYLVVQRFANGRISTRKWVKM